MLFSFMRILSNSLLILQVTAKLSLCRILQLYLYLLALHLDTVLTTTSGYVLGIKNQCDN